MEVVFYDIKIGIGIARAEGTLAFILRAWKRNVQCGCGGEGGGMSVNEGVTCGLGGDER